MIRVIICTFLSIIFLYTRSEGQYSKTASCVDPSFDKTVNSYLSYTVPVVSVQDAFKKKSELIFLDAREFEEYNISHIPTARYVGYDKFRMESIQDIGKDKKIVVYCSIGYRSEAIADKLRKNGYKNVYNLYGSIFEWANAGYQINDKSGISTKKIHTYNKKWSQWVLNPTLQKIW